MTQKSRRHKIRLRTQCRAKVRRSMQESKTSARQLYLSPVDGNVLGDVDNDFDKGDPLRQLNYSSSH